MLNLIKNKKGGEKFLSIWWFFVLVVILTGIVVGVSIFSVSEINTKKLEADALSSRIADCLISQGQINQAFLSSSFDIFDFCRIDRKIIENEKYYLSLEAFKLEDCKKELGVIKCEKSLASYNFGIADFVNQCKIAEATSAKNYPGCSENYIYALNGNEKIVLRIFAGSNQNGRREVI